MNLLTFGMILSGVLLNAGAQLLLKAGTRSLGVIGRRPHGLAQHYDGRRFPALNPCGARMLRPERRNLDYSAIKS